MRISLGQGYACIDAWTCPSVSPRRLSHQLKCRISGGKGWRVFLLLMVSHPPKEGVQSARIVFLFLIQWGQDQILKHGDQLLADYNKAVRVTVENESAAANAKKVDQHSWRYRKAHSF